MQATYRTRRASQTTLLPNVTRICLSTRQIIAKALLNPLLFQIHRIQKILHHDEGTFRQCLNSMGAAVIGWTWTLINAFQC